MLIGPFHISKGKSSWSSWRGNWDVNLLPFTMHRSRFLPSWWQCFSVLMQAEFGFNEHHQNEIINYMRFARSKRITRLKTIDSCFEELKESRWLVVIIIVKKKRNAFLIWAINIHIPLWRLVEEIFTVDEVKELLDGLQTVVRGEVEMELINTAHTNVLLLRQLFSQAEKFYLRLQSDISELENWWVVMMAEIWTSC